MLKPTEIQDLLDEGSAMNIQDYYDNPGIHTPKGFYLFCAYLSNCPINEWVPSSDIRKFIRSQVASSGIVIDKVDWNPAGWFGNYWYWSRHPFRNEYYEILERLETKPLSYRIKEKYFFILRSLLHDIKTPKAIDYPSPASKIKTEVYRTLRDTALARKIKMLHGFECQICGHALDLGNGERYAESHHIKPLREPYCGPDIEENILCVCPNDHALLDYGAIEIKRKSLFGLDLHNLPDEYIDYHNQHIFGKLE